MHFALFLIAEVGKATYAHERVRSQRLGTEFASFNCFIKLN